MHYKNIILLKLFLCKVRANIVYEILSYNSGYFIPYEYDYNKESFSI